MVESERLWVWQCYSIQIFCPGYYFQPLGSFFIFHSTHCLTPSWIVSNSLSHTPYKTELSVHPSIHSRYKNSAAFLFYHPTISLHYNTINQKKYLVTFFFCFTLSLCVHFPLRHHHQEFMIAADLIYYILYVFRLALLDVILKY